MWLTLGAMVNEKRERDLFVAIFGFCQITFNYPYFFPTGGPDY